MSEGVRRMWCRGVGWTGRQDRLDLAALRGQLERERPEVLAVRTIPNARVRWETVAQAEMESAAPPATAGELRERVTRVVAVEPGVDPEDLWTLAESVGYKAAINFSSETAGADGCCEVIFHRVEGVPVFPVPASLLGQTNETFANQPYKGSRDGGEVNKDGQVDAMLSSRLRAYLQGKLPDYMVPAAFVPLSRLPLTPNGKVDRRALPAPDFSRVAQATGVEDATEPATPLEKYLAALWSEILGVERIGTRDNFFESGGDSLSGLRMLNRLRENLGEHLSLVAIFEAPTIQALATLLTTNYASAVDKLCGFPSGRNGDGGDAGHLPAVDASEAPGGLRRRRAGDTACRPSRRCRARRAGSNVRRSLATEEVA